VVQGGVCTCLSVEVALAARETPGVLLRLSLRHDARVSGLDLLVGKPSEGAVMNLNE